MLSETMARHRKRSIHPLTLKNAGPGGRRARCPACHARITLQAQPDRGNARVHIRRLRPLRFEWETNTLSLDTREPRSLFYCVCGRILEVGGEAAGAGAP
ncbi:MAG: hypothetical protein HY558_02765 [Euryarchaeota archaeon]|nr:hypothetical protein [Euryarchaeota archaeon]